MRREVPVRVAPARAVEVERYVADVSGLRRALGLVPEPPLAHLPEMARTAVEGTAPGRTGSATPPASPTDESQPLSATGERAR